MAEILISDLARATGFPSSTLRYYERVGLLEPAGRTAGGYRVYDGAAVERLAFIGRAKRLGLDLDDVRDLIALWDDGACRPVQARLSTLLHEKIALLDAQIDEHARFRTQLAHVQRSLASADAADRCGPGVGVTPISRRRSPSRWAVPTGHADRVLARAEAAAPRVRAPRRGRRCSTRGAHATDDSRLARSERSRAVVFTFTLDPGRCVASVAAPADGPRRARWRLAGAVGGRFCHVRAPRCERRCSALRCAARFIGSQLRLVAADRVALAWCSASSSEPVPIALGPSRESGLLSRSAGPSAGRH